MAEMKDVQQLINDRADAKLKKEVDGLHDSIYNGKAYHLLGDLRVNVGTTEKPKNIHLHSIFGASGFRQHIIEANTENYREAETKEFLEKVESLRQDVDNLLNA